MHQFSNVPTKAADFYKQKDDEVVQKETPPVKKDKKVKEVKETKNKKNDVEKFLDDHVGVGPTDTVVKIQENI